MLSLYGKTRTFKPKENWIYTEFITKTYLKSGDVKLLYTDLTIILQWNKSCSVLVESSRKSQAVLKAEENLQYICNTVVSDKREDIRSK